MNTQLNDREIIEKSSYSTSSKRKFKTIILIVNWLLLKCLKYNRNNKCFIGIVHIKREMLEIKKQKLQLFLLILILSQICTIF